MARLGITDHALVRWLERTGAMDVDRLRTLLAASLERACAAAEVLGQEEYLILVDGLVYVVREGAVITVLTEDQRHAHIHRSINRLRDQARQQESGRG